MEREKGEDDGRWALGEWRGDKSNGWRRREEVLSGGRSHQAREIPRLPPNTALRFYFSNSRGSVTTETQASVLC